MSTQQAVHETVYVDPYTGKSFFDEQELRSYITSSTEGPLQGKTGLALDRDIITVDITDVDVDWDTVELKDVNLDDFDDPAAEITVEYVLSGVETESTTEDDEAESEQAELTEQADEGEEPSSRKESSVEQISGAKRQSIIQNAFRHPEWDYVDIAEEIKSSENYAQNELEKLHDGRWETTAISMIVDGISAGEIEDRLASGEVASPTLNEDKVEEAESEDEPVQTSIRGDKKQEIIQLAFENPDWDYTDIAEEVGSSEGHARSIIKSLRDGEYNPVELAVIVSGMNQSDISAALESGELATYTKQEREQEPSTDDTETEEDPDSDKDFAQQFEAAVKGENIRTFTIAELRSNISAVDDPEILAQARDTDDRSTAVTLYKNRLDSVTADDSSVTWTQTEDEEETTEETVEVDEPTVAEDEAEAEEPEETDMSVSTDLSEAVEQLRAELEEELEEAEEEADILEHADYAKGKAKIARRGLELLPDEDSVSAE